MKEIPGVTILGVEIEFHCRVDRHLYDFGSVTLINGDRNFIFDVVSTTIDPVAEENNFTRIHCQLEVMEDAGYKKFDYNLVEADLYSDDLKATIYIGCEYEITPEKQTLFWKAAECTHALDLTLD